MEKLSDVFKATVAVFHGIISTYLFLEFSEIVVDQLQYLVLLVFFTVVNVMIWSLLLKGYYKLRGTDADGVSIATNDIGALRYRPIDVAGLTVVAVTLGLLTAYLHRQDVILGGANLVGNWRRTHSDAPFGLLLSNVSGRTANKLDGRDPTAVKAANGRAYLRVNVRDSKITYEGFPRISANKRETREVVLSPACRLISDDSAKAAVVQEVEGPGVYIRLVDTAAFEVIDRHQSKCAKLIDAKTEAGVKPPAKSQ